MALSIISTPLHNTTLSASLSHHLPSRLFHLYNPPAPYSPGRSRGASLTPKVAPQGRFIQRGGRVSGMEVRRWTAGSAAATPAMSGNESASCGGGGQMG